MLGGAGTLAPPNALFDSVKVVKQGLTRLCLANCEIISWCNS